MKSEDSKTHGIIFNQVKAVDVIVLDFDGTLIQEHILIEWVFFLLLRSHMRLNRKFFFFFKSFFRGTLSMAFSSRISLCEWAVKTAFKTFEGIEMDFADALVNYQGRNGRYAINLNPGLIKILNTVFNNAGEKPEIEIHSQGSFTYIIKAFLNRRDVISWLKENGICKNSISIHANELETDKNGRFTGRLKGAVRTKYNRIYKIKENAMFIGDEKDEAVFRKTGINRVSFVNWKKLLA